MLPSDWVERIHARLAVRYGLHWHRLWEGLDIEVVRTDWAETLSGFTADDIAHALANVSPDHPPTAGQFRELCRRAPRGELAALPAPREKPPAAVAERLQAVAGKRWGNRAWAERLRDREEKGEALTPSQRQAWREALTVPGSES